MQNIGAYGVEIKETFLELEAFEIKTGKRRIIEFLMAPLLRYQSEALRER